ncbi:MAG: transketolase [Betaproteobacteria bacterium]|nr:transketolase [Betaproteobacteria bacterium]
MHPTCKQIRRDILLASRTSGHGHIPTSFSVVEMLYATYDSMRHDPARPAWTERDIFILSKGHAALGFYCVLARAGYFPVEEVKTFGAYMSKYGCHPDRRKVPGVEVSTGSLGHGIGVAVGMSLAFKLQENGRRVYTLVGDGEANEGSTWEAIMVAINLDLSNLTILFDFNKSQVRSLQISNPAERLRAFGCEVFDVDGHDVSAMKAALGEKRDAVKVVVGNTMKGYGCETLEQNMFEWHRKSPDDVQLEALLRELDRRSSGA